MWDENSVAGAQLLSTGKGNLELQGCLAEDWLVTDRSSHPAGLLNSCMRSVERAKIIPYSGRSAPVLPQWNFAFGSDACIPDHNLARSL